MVAISSRISSLRAPAASRPAKADAALGKPTGPAFDVGSGRAALRVWPFELGVVTRDAQGQEKTSVPPPGVLATAMEYPELGRYLGEGIEGARSAKPIPVYHFANGSMTWDARDREPQVHVLPRPVMVFAAAHPELGRFVNVGSSGGRDHYEFEYGKVAAEEWVEPWLESESTAAKDELTRLVADSGLPNVCGISLSRDERGAEYLLLAYRERGLDGSPVRDAQGNTLLDLLGSWQRPGGPLEGVPIRTASMI